MLHFISITPLEVQSDVGFLFQGPEREDRCPEDCVHHHRRLFQVVEAPGHSLPPSQKAGLSRGRLPRRRHPGYQGQPRGILRPLSPGLFEEGPGGVKIKQNI
jgi:hypothetical protein